MSVVLLAILAAAVPIGAMAVVGIIAITRGMQGGCPYPSCGNARCRYDLSGSIGHADRCPECGCAFAEVGIRPPTRSRNIAAVVTGVALIIAPFLLGSGIITMLLARYEATRAQQTIVVPMPNVLPQQPPPVPPRDGSQPFRQDPLAPPPPAEPADE